MVLDYLKHELKRLGHWIYFSCGWNITLWFKTDVDFPEKITLANIVDSDVSENARKNGILAINHRIFWAVPLFLDKTAWNTNPSRAIEPRRWGKRLYVGRLALHFAARGSWNWTESVGKFMCGFIKWWFRGQWFTYHTISPITENFGTNMCGKTGESQHCEVPRICKICLSDVFRPKMSVLWWKWCFKLLDLG